MRRYADLLPAVDDPLSLDEGGSPLALLRQASGELGIQRYVKNGTVNPMWSFKDRYAAVALSVAHQFGYTKVVCTSTATSGGWWRRTPRWVACTAWCRARRLARS